MSIKIYPKINIFLKIIGRDGKYHHLCSRFVRGYGTLYDEMEIRTAQHFSVDGAFQCALEDNLIFKAKCTLQEYLRKKEAFLQAKALETLKVHVEKAIPIGAGLGGGSADAGAFLHVVNELFEIGLNQKEIIAVGTLVGSDVGFCASYLNSANVSGKGDIIESFNENILQVAIYTPHIVCDTAAVYRLYAESIALGKQTYSSIPTAWLTQKSKTIVKNTKDMLNDLYWSACNLYPQLKEIKNELGKEWHFSGSGSSFFKILDTNPQEA